MGVFVAHLDRRGGVVGVAEVVRLVTEAAAQVLAVGEATGRSGTDVLIYGLYPPVCPLHEKLRMKETLNTENDAIGAADTYSHTAHMLIPTRRPWRLTQKLQRPCWHIRPGTSGRRGSRSPLKGRSLFQWKTW